MFEVALIDTGEKYNVYATSTKNDKVYFLLYVCDTWDWFPAKCFKPIN